MNYISVVSQYTVRIIIIDAALNDLGIRFFDIGNIYLKSDTYKKV